MWTAQRSSEVLQNLRIIEMEKNQHSYHEIGMDAKEIALPKEIAVQKKTLLSQRLKKESIHMGRADQPCQPRVDHWIWQ